MGWTNPRTWVAGEKPTAAVMNQHIRDNLLALNGFAQKTADESVTSSTTLQDDDHLQYTIDATGKYVFELTLFARSAADAAGDLRIDMVGPAGTFTWGAIGLDVTLASGNTGTVNTAASGSPYNFGLSTTQLMIIVKGLFVATATGTLKLQWAQQASNANASTIKAGSHMTVKQVA